jgi:hypothetical protein
MPPAFILSQDQTLHILYELFFYLLKLCYFFVRRYSIQFSKTVHTSQALLYSNIRTIDCQLKYDSIQQESFSL